MVAPILAQGDVGRKNLPTCCMSVKNHVPYSSTSWARAYLYAKDALDEVNRQGGNVVGIGLGSDVNGLAELPGPRFGPRAAEHVAGDKVRGKDRRWQLDAQSNGVQYERPSGTVDDARFGDAHPTGYSGDEIAAWKALDAWRANLSSTALQGRARDILCGLEAKSPRG